ncbi:MAG: hypothetical protein GF398_20850 [Chitinivibrionales bacterium]|nr:hypothetical protein [Chitinivibrionales bacterium]
MYDESNKASVEKYSSAVTLSDMEVFIFPDVMYSLVLANIMSPKMWEWKKDPWFEKMAKLNPYRKVLRLKQFIMDKFVFNLDLDTWGLTTKAKELARFSDFIDAETLSQSNALFGYEGDKYYFDIDIRRHFGLDKYNSEVIPYWKTETLEAMDAFRHKEAYPTGAGECVSLAALYAGALFVLGEIPLEQIYLMATPLHSQNFVDVKDGIITNNRRVVTRNMWYNGTELTAKARRALQNERVTVVAHTTGYVHTLYPQATMSPHAYRHLQHRLGQYLKTDVNFGIIANFLRDRSDLQKCFQIVHDCCGKPRYIEAEKAFAYEHGSSAKVGDNTQSSLLHEIDEDEYYTQPFQDRILLNEVESALKGVNFSIDKPDNLNQLKEQLHHTCYNVEQVIDDLLAFCKIAPRLPGHEKDWTESKPISLEGVNSHADVIERLESQRRQNETADLAFMAYRDMTKSPWKPFLKAALERNPVSIAGAAGLSIDQAADKLRLMNNESIYDGTRMAQPDEVWNFNRGSGLEKALCLMNIMCARRPENPVELTGDAKRVCVGIRGGREYLFELTKKAPLPAKHDFDGIINS